MYNLCEPREEGNRHEDEGGTLYGLIVYYAFGTRST